MFATDDTIVAIATPPGKGGIGVVRISGPASLAIAQSMLQRSNPLQPRHATFTRIRDVDEVVATFFAEPHSYTGQDVVEISAHGSPVVLRAILRAAMDAGARLAEPGEFTLRAFLGGRLDLIQSEAVADLVDAATPLQARTAFDQLEGTLTSRIAAIEASLFDVIARLEASLDFPEEGYHFIEPTGIRSVVGEIISRLDALLADATRGRTIREGARVVVTGRPNVGKSSIFNELAGHERAIVTEIPGTTRDLITETVDLGGIPVALVDTAGVRETVDIIEREGVHRARQATEIATMLLVVLDQSEPLREDDWRVLTATRGRERLVLRNKTDLPPAWDADVLDDASMPVSAATGSGVARLRAAILATLTGREDVRDAPAVSNARHIALLGGAREHLAHAADGAGESTRLPEEFLLADLELARSALEEITGRRTADDLLRHIFERFCIGK
jgi:tRNA modification GTPase